MNDCIFCKIVQGKIPSNNAYEDDKVYAFHDINPAAPTHILIIPKVHIGSANEIKGDNAAIVGHIFSVIPAIAKAAGIDQSGYRVVNNCGADGGQTVGHLHFHLLGGRALAWPPG